MHCTACGTQMGPDAVSCPSCGTAVVRASARPATVRRCPRCGYWGQGVKYFARTSHLGILAGLSIVTYGIGGLTYWLVCRKRRVCPSCGLGWESSTRLLEAPESAPPGGGVVRVHAAPHAVEGDAPLPPGGLARRVFGAGVILVATLMILMGIVTFTPEMIAVGGVMGAGGSLTFLWGWGALQARRKAVMRGMERKILRLAKERRGVLTVTDVAAELDLSLEAAEKILIGMDDGFRIRSDVTDVGVIVYEFPEIKHRPQLESGV